MENARPKWTHDTAEDLARWLIGNRVTKITHHWEFTGEDTSRSWIRLHTESGDKAASLDVPSSYFHSSPEFMFAPDHAGLIQARHYSRVRETIEAIDKWETANSRDRSEYERLKKKFA